MQSKFDLSIVIGGDAGQGVESSGASFSSALARAGCYVFAVTDYRSRIRGGHNFYQIRLSDQPLQAHSDPIHLVIALTRETIDVHMANMAPGGGIIYDANLTVDTTELTKHNVIPLPAPLTKIAEACGSKVMMNTAAQAVAMGILGVPLTYLESVLQDRFQHKGEKVVNGNLRAAKQAYEYALVEMQNSFAYRFQPPANAPRRILINGNEALALGAAAGGCRFIAAYPMTPATTIFEWLTAHASQIGIVTKQAEDEIAAALMTVGAAFAGARAMTCTSGGGFNLVTETIGFAAMCEIPFVAVNVQRGGPSTGLPTRTEQSDLLFVLHPSHGDFPRIVLAPHSIQECFTVGWRAFNLAEHYQCPVIILSDTYLSSSLVTLEWDALDLGDVRWDRGALLSQEQLDAATDYLRFKLTSDGISPRAIPGQKGAVHAPSTDEHSEDGHISEAIDNRIAMMCKRMGKMEMAQEEMNGPQVVGPETADVTLVVWGSVVGAAQEAAHRLTQDGITANVLYFADLWPFPVVKAKEKLGQARNLIAVEQNYSAQLAQLIRMATGTSVNSVVTKFDGRPISPGQIQQAVMNQLLPAARS